MKKFLLTKLLLNTVLVMAVSSTWAQSVSDYSALPPTSSDSSTPLVMLVMSRDNQLWHKAYNDYSDLDGDGNLDTTYNDNFEYYGYFNSDFCYTYSSNIYSPVGPVSTGTHRCSGARWSGNFLNWLTTTRIDVVRKVLYGGYRSTDAAGNTVLQRAFIPPDNHAFVKIVRDADITGSISDYTPISGYSELSFCNVTNASGRSGLVNVDIAPPLLKVAVGRHPTWAGSETAQCLFQEEGGHSGYVPSRPSIPGVPLGSRFIVRVQVCVGGVDVVDEDTDECRGYTTSSGSTDYKPYGLLQTYGETGRYKFGLMTGSYENNIEGGVLRKNITFMGGPAATTSDLEIDTETGIFVPKSSSEQGIISALNRMKISGWDYSHARYADCDAPGISVSDFKSSIAPGRQCRDWGNPISEIYVEALRYLAGESPTPGFLADDTPYIPGLLTVPWSDPYTEETACSNCSIIVLSTGLNNFDGDDLSVSGLPGLSSAANLMAVTDRVGEAEGLDTGNYIVGATTANPNGVCDDKSLAAGLSTANGLCPEAATLEGTYNLAGAAHYAHQEDLRTDLDGDQHANTYTVSLAESLPSFEIVTQSLSAEPPTISFVPTCGSNSSGSASLSSSGWIECSLVDLTVVENTNVYKRYLISWEDSSWGNDYDMDAYAVVEVCTATGSASDVQADCPSYTTDENGNAAYAPYHQQPQWGSAAVEQVQLRVSMIGASAGFAMKFGYIMNGATSGNGAHDEILRPGGYNGNSVALTGGASNYVLWSSAIQRFTASASTPDLLQNPLWYAAKYGNFEDLNEDGRPDSDSEWDRFHVDGSDGDDNIPDGYFPVSNPANLPQALDNIFRVISTRVSSGSAAAVNSQTGRGEGAVYQALFAARKEALGGDSVSWIGTINALFLDQYGYLREDNQVSGTQAQLDSADPVIQIRYDSDEQEARVQRYVLNADGSLGATIGASFPLDDPQFSPIWSAQEQVSSLVDYDSNRSSYTSSAANGRFIFTAIDRDGDGLVIEPDWATVNPGSSSTDDGAYPFVKSNFPMTDSDASYLGFGPLAVQADVDDLVDYVRGVEGITGMRSRTLSGQRYLLGDIVHSTPEVVGRPSSRYDVLYGDETYAAFYDHYRHRRNVVYVGANDGMLHALNGGVFDPQAISYDPDGHPLGSELWAYIPYNLLPHLQWLGSPSYPHVYYVDGPVQSFDVNIFPNDADHPGGWGTILVVGFRFGGGDYSFDHDHDGGTTTPNITTRSGYVILDVTNPETEPELIAEITDADLGFTTSAPTLLKNRVPNGGGNFASPASNDWYLVFGSGPGGTDVASKRAAITAGVSGQPARLYMFDLVNKTISSEIVEPPVSPAPQENGFVGSVASGDWNSDFVDDALYFGVNFGTATLPEGRFKRGRVNSYTGAFPSMNYRNLYDDRSLPFTAVPLTYREGNNFWVFTGSGRFIVAEDNMSEQPQTYFGFKETKASGSSATIDDSNMVDMTDVVVFEDGRVREGPSLSTAVLSANGVTSGASSEPPVERFADARRFVRNNSNGWFFNFRHPLNPFGAPDSYNGIRNTTKAALSGTNLVITAYDGSGEICDAEGTGFLYVPRFDVGLPAPFAPVGTDGSYRLTTEVSGQPDPERVLNGVELGPGVPSDPKVVSPSASSPSQPCQQDKVFVQTSLAELDSVTLGCEPAPTGRKSWVEIPVSW